jgi:hypothetical protein
VRTADEETLLDESVDALVGLLGSADADDQEDLLQQLASFGLRTAAHVASLSTALDRGHAALGLGWRSGHHTTSVVLTREGAQRLSTLLRTMETTERALVASGRVVGGSLVHRTFELELEDGTVLTGRADEDVLSTLEELFGHECTAYLLVTEALLAFGETKDSYRLQRLEP